MRKALSLAPGVAFFVFFAATLPDPKASKLIGIVAISIALGAIAYYFINSPHGRRDSETAFGVSGRYIFPVYGTIIPRKVMIGVVGSVLSLLSLGALLYHFGY